MVGGKIRNFQRRKYCLSCSPFGSGNTSKLEKKDTKPKSEKYLKWQRKARYERKVTLVNLRGGGCSKCGYNKCIQALDFHHRNPKTKKFGLSTQGILRRWELVVAEAKKCDVLCRNCHAEIHWKGRNNV